METGLKAEIKAFCKGDVSDAPDAIARCSHDASLFEMRPRLVVAPKDAADVGRLVSFVASRPDLHLSITARSAGTDMSGGALTDSICLDMLPHFSHMKAIGDECAVTEPGVYYRDFDKATLAHGLFLPSFPASRELCTVGGMVANNSGGEKSLRYGKTENFVRALRVVLRDGQEHLIQPLSKEALDAKMRQDDIEGDIHRRLYRLIEDNAEVIRKAKPDVSKNSAGYYLWNVWDGTTFDLTKLITGSQGTLGIITEITFRLVKPATHSKLLVIFLKDLRRVPEIINGVLAHGPESFESYDDNTLKFAMRYARDIMAQLGAKNVFSLAWQFVPELLMVATRGFPKQVILAEFTGMTEAEVDAKVEAAHGDLSHFGLAMRITKTEQEATKYRVIRRESFNLLRKHFKKKKAAPFIDDFCVRPAQLPEFLPKLYAILDEYKLMLTVVGHFGDGNFHIIPLMDIERPETVRVIKELSARVYELVCAYGGSITGEHNDGLVRGPYLREMYGEEVYRLFEEVKRIFDPAGIFNPGKKTGATIERSFSLLRKG